MKKIFYTLTATLALMTSCQNEAQESVLTLADEVTVNFGMDFGITDVVLTRAEHNFEYLIAVSEEAASEGTITSGYVGRFSSLAEAYLALKANTSYNFYISAFESTGDTYNLSSICGTTGQFTEVTSPVSYAPAFADQRVDRYYGSKSQTLTGNTTINVEGKHFAYGINVNIARPLEGHVTLTCASPALSYDVASDAASGVEAQNIFCMEGTDLNVSKTTTLIVTLYDSSNKVVTTVSKEVTVARNHAKTFVVNALDPNASFVFTPEEGEDDGNEDITPPTAGDTSNGHEYVDLGVVVDGKPIYWATCNVGAESPEDYGLYFAWGDTEGHSVDIDYWVQPDGYSYDWSTAPFNNGSSNYDESYFNSVKDEVCPDGILALAYDAAHVQWGGDWRMPTVEELDALRTQCTWTWDSVKKGSTVVGSNGKSIFLPAAGYRSDSKRYSVGSEGFYWPSSLNSEECAIAYTLLFASTSDHIGLYSYYRYGGQSVRPVCVLSE